MNTSQVISRIKLTSIGGTSNYSTFVPVIGTDRTYGLNGVLHPSLIPSNTTGDYTVNGNLTVNNAIYTGTGEIAWNGTVWQAGATGALHTIPFDDAVVHLAGSETISGTKAFSTITATTINGLTIASTTGQLNIANSKTLTCSGTLSFAGTDSTSFTFPPTSGIVLTTDTLQAQLISKTYNRLSIYGVLTGATFNIRDASVLTFPSGTDTVIANNTLQGQLTGKTYNGLTINSTSGALNITNDKTLSVANTLNLNSNDGATLSIGAGGTLGSNAYTSTSYATTAQLASIFGVTTNTPTNGSTAAFTNSYQQETLYLNHTSTITGVTINFPTSQVTGQKYIVTSKSVVNSTVNWYVSGGSTPITIVSGTALPTSLTAGQTITLQATGTSNQYIRLQ